MRFDEILDRASQAPETRGNTLGDGRLSCRYGEVPAFLDLIDRFLDAHGVTRESCVAVECPNVLPGALLFLSLLRRGSSFVIAPSTVNQSETKPVPHFCRFKLTVSSAIGAARESDFDPTSVLTVETNSGFGGQVVSPAKLYLRTSGSMGVSKIVVHDHGKLIGNAGNVVAKYGFSPESRATIPVPIAHMYGFGAEFLPAVLVGASIDLQEKTNLLKYLDREKRFRPTIAFATPAICEMLAGGYKSPRTGYQVFVTSGQRIGEQLFRRFDPLVGGRLVNQYGSTEMGAVAACAASDGVDDKASTIGSAMSGVELRIDNGVLFCRHPYGFEGYLDENGAWLHRETPGEWYRSGDLAELTPSGRIAVTGRADASLNRSGYLVILSDIERMMEKLEAIGQVAVVPGQGETKQGQRIVAFCVLNPGSTVDGADLRKLCHDLLPHYAIPDEVRVMSSLPLLETGKFDRRALAGLTVQS